MTRKDFQLEDLVTLFTINYSIDDVEIQNDDPDDPVSQAQITDFLICAGGSPARASTAREATPA